MKNIRLGNLFADRVATLDPREFPNEAFDLWSIPAYDVGRPDLALGSDIGSTKKCVVPNDVLLSRIVPHIRRSCVVSQREGRRQIASGEWIVFRSTSFFPQYLRHFLLSDRFHVQFMQTVAGVGGSLLRARPDGVSRITIPLPSLSEQRQIALILDQAEKLRQMRRSALVLLDKLKESIFLDMFVRNEQAEWPTGRINDLAADMRTGPFGSQLLHSEFIDDGIAVLGIDNAVNNEFRWDERRFISEEKYRSLRRYTVRPGDVLITIMGTCGRCAVVPDDIPVAINTKHLCCITIDRAKALPKFLHAAFLRHPAILQQLGVQAKGAVMPGLNMGIIRDLKLRIPPLEVQRVFVSRMDVVDEMVIRCRRHQDRLDQLFASLQERAFSGELITRRAERKLALAG